MTTYADYMNQITELKNKAEAVRQQEIGAAREQVLALMREHGLTAADIEQKPARKSSPVPIKYRDPETNKTWTGRGRMPIWMAGKDKAAFAVQ